MKQVASQMHAVRPMPLAQRSVVTDGMHVIVYKGLNTYQRHERRYQRSKLA